MYLPTVLVVCYRCCKLRSWLPSCLGFSCRCTFLMGWCLPRFSSASHGSSSTLGCRGGVPRFARHRHTQSHSFSFRGSSGIWTFIVHFRTCFYMRGYAVRDARKIAQRYLRGWVWLRPSPHAPVPLLSATEDGSFAISRRFAFKGRKFWN